MPYVPTSSANHQTEHADPRSAVFGHPDDVLKDWRLTADEKRCLLAAWACDTNAVPHIPSLRQLPDGSIVNVDEILDALESLGRLRRGHFKSIEFAASGGDDLSSVVEDRSFATGLGLDAGQAMTTTTRLRVRPSLPLSRRQGEVPRSPNRKFCWHR